MCTKFTAYLQFCCFRMQYSGICNNDVCFPSSYTQLESLCSHLLHLDEDHIFDSFRFFSSFNSFFFCYFPSLFLIDKWIKKYDSSSHTYKKHMIPNVDKNVGILCFSINRLNLRTHQILNAECAKISTNLHNEFDYNNQDVPLILQK